MQGIVKWFNNKRGYGFISGEDGKEYFVYYQNIFMEGFKHLKNGSKVSFTPSTSEKGFVATNVSLS